MLVKTFHCKLRPNLDIIDWLWKLAIALSKGTISEPLRSTVERQCTKLQTDDRWTVKHIAP